MYLLDYLNTTFIFDSLGYFYTIDHFLVLFSWKYFINYKFFFVHLLLIYDIYIYVFLYLIIFFYFLILVFLFIIIIYNYLFRLNIFNKIVNLLFFLFLGFFSIFLNLVYLPRIYFNNKQFDYRFRLDLFENFKILLNQHYSKTIIWNFWIIFLMTSHVQIFLLYLKFFLFNLFRFFLLLALRILFFFNWYVKKIIISYMGVHAYYIYMYIQLVKFIFFRSFLFFNVAVFWKKLWLNYYSLIYNYIFVYVLHKLIVFSVDNYTYTIISINSFFTKSFTLFFTLLKIFSMYLLYLKFFFIHFFINNLRISKLYFYILKLFIYLFFILFNLLLRVNVISVYAYLYYFISFYVHIFIYLFLFIFKSIQHVLRVLFLFLYFLFLPFFFILFKKILYLFYTTLRYILSFRLVFLFIIFIISISFFDFIFFYNLILLIFDFFAYIYVFLKKSFLPIFNMLNSIFQFNSFDYTPFFKLTYLHGSIYYEGTYNDFLDLYYWFRVHFILFFPYKYFFISKFILNLNNIFYSFIFFNQLLLVLWYFYISIIFTNYVFISFFFIWGYFVYFLLYSTLKFFVKIFILYFDIFYFWFISITYIHVNLFIFLNFINLIDFFLVKLFILDTSFLVTFYFIYYDILNFFFINVFISWFFLLLDSAYFFTYQYPFDVFADDIDALTADSVYLKNRLKSRFYRYYYYYYYNYRLNYGTNYFFYNNDVVNFVIPFTKFKHKLRNVPNMSYSQVITLQVLNPALYTKWKSLLYLKAKYKLFWGIRFANYQTEHTWLSDIYRSNMSFLNNNLNPLAFTYAYNDRSLFTRPGFGFYDVDSFYNIINIVNLIFVIVIFYIFSSTFRKLYFPSLWYVNNSEYLWTKLRLDVTKHSLWLYKDRSLELPLGITRQELQEGTRFTYSDLALRAGLEQTNFLPFIFSNQFTSYYKNRYPGDLDKLMIFDYFCNRSYDYNEYLKPLYLRESYHHFTELGSEEKEYLSVPYNFDIDRRYIFLQSLNSFFYKVDKLFNLNLPAWVFHKELANEAYYKFPEGTYFIPYDVSNLFESVTCWFLIFPAVLYNMSSFEFIFSMSSVIALDIFNKLFNILSLNPVFDSFFYFIYMDLIVIDPDNLNSQWTFLRGVYNDSFFFPRYPVFFDYYSNLYYKKIFFFDFFDCLVFKSTTYVRDLKAFFLSFIILFTYTLLLLFLVLLYYYSYAKLFTFKDKNLDYISKFKFYFFKKYINKKLIYGFNYKA